MRALLIVVILTGITSCTGVYEDRGEAGDVLTAEQLIRELSSNQRYLPPEQVADMIINRDPSMLLLDVREPVNYTQYHLPGSINLPLKTLLQGAIPDSINCEKQSLVFYADSDVLAEKAWLYIRSRDCRDLYIMKGGLNAWIENIINPDPPGPLADSEEISRYQNQLGAAEYFLGSSHALETEPYVEKVIIRKVDEEPVRKKIELTPRKKRPNASEEGC